MEADLARDTEVSGGQVLVAESLTLRPAGSRTRQLFEEDLQKARSETDCNFQWLLIFEWIAAIVSSLIISPVTWSGTQSYLHIHVFAAVVYGGLLTALPLYLIKTQPGSSATRNCVALCQMLFSDLFIQLSGGRIETHFSVFGSLAFLSFYRDWRVLVTASTVVALTHGIRGVYWPQSIYGTLHPEPWRFMEHVFWVAFEDLWLIIGVNQSVRDKWRRAEQQSQLELSKQSVEGEVVVRTAQLKASEQAFRQLAETAPVGIFQTDADGTNLFMNSQLPVLMDCDANALLHGGWKSLLDSDTILDIAAQWQQSIETKREFRIEAAIIGRSGRRIHLRTNAVPVFYESGDFRGYIGAVEDITDFKITEQKLLLERFMSSAFVEATDFDSTIRMILQEIAQVADWDCACFQSVGGCPSCDEGATCWHVATVSNEMLAAILEAEVKAQGLLCLEPLGAFIGYLAVPVMSGAEWLGTLKLASTRVSSLDDYAISQLRVLGENLGQHITRYRAERTVKAREAMLRAIHNSVAEAIVALDEDGLVISSNVAAETVFGGAEDKLARRSLWDLVPNYGLQNFDLNVWRAITAELRAGQVKSWEAFGRRLNGVQFPVEIALSDAGFGEKPVLVAVIRDISERRESEKKVSEFYSIVSHELRTPLTSIRGSLGLISGGLTGEIPPDAMELLGIAGESCDRLIRLINDILDLKKLESGKFQFRIERLHPQELVAVCLNQIEGFAGSRSVKLTSEFSCSGAILADRDRVLQVLTNLISNAIKFSSVDKVVHVSVRDAENDRIRFQVSDCGPGIKDEHLSLLFGKFQQIDSSDARAQEGTGLGLAICKSIVEQLEGTIGVQSIPGSGSTFWFELPAYKQE